MGNQNPKVNNKLKGILCVGGWRWLPFNVWFYAPSDELKAVRSINKLPLVGRFVRSDYLLLHILRICKSALTSKTH